MKKVFFSLMFAIIVSTAYAFDVNGISYKIKSTTELTCEVSEGEYSGEVSIPEKVTYNNKEYTVVGIGESAFRDCKNLTKISIPSSVTNIANYAFRDCSSLSEVRIEDGVDKLTLGYNKYYKNSSSKYPDVEGLFSVQPITSLYLGRELDYTTYTTDYDLCSPFYSDYKNSGNDKLNNITIGPNVLKISPNLFADCDGLEKITIGENVSIIDRYAFYDCDALVELKIGEKVETIEVDAFSGCGAMTQVEIPRSVKTINSSFGSLKKILWNAENCSNCSNDWVGKSIETIEFGESVESIPSSICLNQTNLREVIIGKSVKTIGNDAFSGCISVTSVVWNAIDCLDFSCTPFNDCKETIEQFSFGNNIEYIPSYLCNGLSKISSISIPKTVKNLGNYTFYGCNNLSKIYSCPTLPPSINDYTFSSIQHENSTLYIYENSKHAYTNDVYWQNFFNITTIAGGEDLSIILSIEYPDGAIIKHLYEYNQAATLNIIPAEDWSINTITFNDVDVTSELDDVNCYTTPQLTTDSRISIVVRKNEIPTNVESVSDSEIKVYVRNGVISIIGADDAQESVIYDIYGAILYKGMDKEICLDKKGVFLLCIDGKTFKFML